MTVVGGFRDLQNLVIAGRQSTLLERTLLKRMEARIRCGRDQCETTSTSPSTPLTTLKGRSYTLPSFLAMARYSPSAKMTRGNAPIDSLMTSPPGVITDQAVFARASPPLSLTSFSVMTAARWVMVTSVSLPACTRISERTTELASP